MMVQKHKLKWRQKFDMKDGGLVQNKNKLAYYDTWLKNEYQLYGSRAKLL